MPHIIKVAGRARVAFVDGKRVERPDKIFVGSERQWFETVDTYSHFVYKQDWKMGSTLMCTCGSAAGIYNYEAYRKYYSSYQGRLVCCNSFMQNGVHGDGSTE